MSYGEFRPILKYSLKTMKYWSWNLVRSVLDRYSILERLRYHIACWFLFRLLESCDGLLMTQLWKNHVILMIHTATNAICIQFLKCSTANIFTIINHNYYLLVQIGTYLLSLLSIKKRYPFLEHYFVSKISFVFISISIGSILILIIL